MNDARIMNSIRAMAWQRAKGELKSILETYWDEDYFEKMSDAVDNFIDLVEGEGWAE